MEIDGKVLEVESHSLMLLNRQITSPSHFPRNPTSGVITTTDFLAYLKLLVAEKIFWNI